MSRPEAISIEREETDEALLRRVIFPRKSDSRKGENGVVAVIGGSWLYHGAPTLAALAAFRTGVDLVYLSVPQKLADSVRAISPNLIVLPFPDSKLTKGAAQRTLKWLPEVNSAVIGPGLAKHSPAGIVTMAEGLIERGAELVLDATALSPEISNVVSGHRVVLTPHAGEFRKIFGTEVGDSFDKRIAIVKSKAAEINVTVLLKGPVDIISDGNKVILNRTGTPAMTVGGTGDVLSGVVAALLSKGATPIEAAAAGAMVNGLAGELAESKYGLRILATDVIEELPSILKPYDRKI